MNPREFHVLAEELVKSNSPAKIRSAISRAYYSAFHVGGETLRQLGFSVSKGGAAHGEVARCLANSLDQQTEAAATTLRGIHTMRIRAEYDLARTDIEDPAAARRIVDDGQFVIQVLDKIPASPQRSAIQRAIAAWRKANGYP